MPRVIVISEPDGKGRSVVTLSERVISAHLVDDHSAGQLIERVGWAILDAEETESATQTDAGSPAAARRPWSSIRMPSSLSEEALAA